MKITIKEIAKAANVSVTTVSMALNDKKGVNRETQKKVKTIAGQLGYIPNHSARSLVTSNSNCIGLIIPEIINPYYSAIVDIMSSLAEKRGLTMLLGISKNKSRLEMEYIKTFLFHRALGVVIVPMLSERPDTAHLDMLRMAGIPFVFCTETYENEAEPGVMCDFEQGEYELIRFLLDKGIRNICFVTVNYNALFAKLRMKGLLRAFQEKGLEVSRDHFFFLKEPTFQGAYAVTDEIVSREPEAIVTINDIMAIGVMKRLSERGIRIPQDVWVAGFDDVTFAELAQTPITTVRQPLWEICGKCMEILDHKIQGPKSPGIQNDKNHFIKAELVVRGTTGS